DPRLDVGVAGLADCRDAAAGEADVRLHDAPVVHDQRIGDDRVHHLRPVALPLAHAVADDLAAAELHFLAINGVVAFHLDDEARVTQAQAIAGGGAEHLGIGATVHAAHSGPITLPWKPKTSPRPARRTRVTSRVWPGSKRTAVPAGMSRRKPRAAGRSKRKASLTSKKW